MSTRNEARMSFGHLRMGVLLAMLALLCLPALAAVEAWSTTTLARGVFLAAQADVGSSAAQAPPFTRAHLHVFLAFAAAWVIVFAYVQFLHRRFERLRDELRSLS